jgi:pimeloyl-ACP methyl ester carboxylesterase
VNGARLAIETSGAGDDAVVLVHAGVADRRMWAPLVAELPEHRAAISYDMRGFGESELPPEPFSQARDLVGLLDALQLDDVVLVGASYGGRVALEVASNWPDRVRGLALLAPAALEHDWSARFVEFGDAEDAAFEAGDVERAVELNVRLWVDGPRAPTEVDPAVRALVADMQRRAFELQEGVEAEEEPMGVEPGRITAPTVLAVGELDLPDFHEIARDLAATIPGVVEHATVGGVAHLPALERPADVARLVARVM